MGWKENATITVIVMGEGGTAAAGSWMGAESWKTVYEPQYAQQVTLENDAKAKEHQIQVFQARSNNLSAANATDESEGFTVTKAMKQRVTDLSNKANATGPGSLHAGIAQDRASLHNVNTKFSIMNAELSGALGLAAIATAATVFLRRRHRKARGAHGGGGGGHGHP